MRVIYCFLFHPIHLNWHVTGLLACQKCLSFLGCTSKALYILQKKQMHHNKAKMFGESSRCLMFAVVVRLVPQEFFINEMGHWVGTVSGNQWSLPRYWSFWALLLGQSLPCMLKLMLVRMQRLFRGWTGRTLSLMLRKIWDGWFWLNSRNECIYERLKDRNREVSRCIMKMWLVFSSTASYSVWSIRQKTCNIPCLADVFCRRKPPTFDRESGSEPFSPW